MGYTSEERRQNREKWAARISEWKTSGLSGAAWCREKGLKYEQFIQWKKRLSQKLGLDSFIEIAETSDSSGIEIVLNEVSIRLSKNFDSSTLHRCLRILKDCKC